tara:strand:- start:1777 stop:2691 length:915 start_codon:yes stop_codon:yes gene_type:complete
MKTAIVGILLGISNFAAADIGGAVKPISTERCNGKLAVRDTNGGQWKLDGASAVNNETYVEGHDFYSEDSGNRFKSEWDEMVGQYRGIDQACEKFNNALNKISQDFVDPPSRTNQYVSSPPNWKRAVTKILHDSGCAISKHDDNLEQFLESFNYPFQQKLRMENARTAASDYADKIADLQQQWKNERQALVDTMKKHGDTMNRWITKADLEAANQKYADATARLLGDENSAKAEIKKVRGSISKHAVDFEVLAHKLKRDSLRWSKLNQIAGEQERLDVLTEIVRMNAYDVLVTCLVNFQLTYND